MREFRKHSHQRTQNTIFCTTCNNEFPKTKEFFTVRKARILGDSLYFTTICNKCRVAKNKIRRHDIFESFVAVTVKDARARAKKKGIPFNIDVVFMLKKFESQQGKCALTGITLTRTTNSETARQSTNMSIDQIMPNKGYTKDNVQWVCNWANMAKSKITTGEFIEYCKQVIEYNTDIQVKVPVPSTS